MTTIVDSLPAGPTNPSQLAAFEQHISYALPPAYAEFLLRHNGGHPDPDAFVLRQAEREEEHILFCFFPMQELALGQVKVDTLDDLRKWPLHCAWDDLQHDLKTLYKTKLDPPLLPIGTDGLSNYITIALAGSKAGAVVFLDHKTARPWPLAPGFPAFLASLHPRTRKDHRDQAMRDGPPDLIAINHDDYHAQHVGRTADGRQFFLTTPFEPGIDRKPGNEFVALFLFDLQGKLLEAKIDQFGPRDTMNEQNRRAVYEARLRELGKVKYQRIEIAPFSVKRFGVQFGLIPQPPEEEGEEWAVEFQPGNYMAFHKPWDSGDYDT
jgi:hypothetical protein